MATIGCSFGHCEDLDAALVELQAAPFNISRFIWSRIRTNNPMIRLLESTKETFPSGMGDTLTVDVRHINEPSAFEARNWSRLKMSAPGENACCFELNEMQFGQDRVSGCMYKYGLKTPPICKVDLSLRYKWEEQLRQQFDTMEAYAKGTWSHWLNFAYAKSVLNVVLNQSLGYPSAVGRYPEGVYPTSKLTYTHAQMMARAVRREAGDPGEPVPAYTTLVMSEDDAFYFEDAYLKSRVALGYRSSNVEDVPTLNNELGAQTKRVGMFMIVMNSSARKFRLPTGAETWDDAQVEESVQVAAMSGTSTVHNPAYDAALFSETHLISLSAVRWLTPPIAMTSANRMFPATQYSGQFVPVFPSQDCDPFRQQAYFAALFVSGMLGIRPRKGRSILHLAAQQCAIDELNECEIPEAVLEANNHPLYRVVPLDFSTGQLQIRFRGTLPSPCPVGHSLFLVTNKGDKFLVNNVISTEAWAGDAEHINGGSNAIISLVDTAAAVDRDGCSPWASIACLPSATPVSSAFARCAGCGPIADGDQVLTDCVRTFAFDSDTAIQLIVEGSPVLTGGPFTSAATLKTAIETYVATSGKGGGTVAVSKSAAHHWVVTITGNSDPDLADATMSYQDGSGASGGTNTTAAISTNCGFVD